jgi:hypothetical protein
MILDIGNGNVWLTIIAKTCVIEYEVPRTR